ncbi:2-oxoglutarate (2OG) and Fe(II)-dependent oxygenase superfamily protein [Euphorbia peplus]|nr:2-oxoglutarate (2OG) and Fe(II)-dependent oxygenase superfamily protein [Euphorbia peplus]
MKWLQSWPEPVVRVQSLAESGIKQIPECYIKPPSHRPSFNNNKQTNNNNNIPVINLENVFSNNEALREEALQSMSKACREWGFFQIVDHGVKPELLENIRKVWREFFKLPLETKQKYANSPATYEGYGSRLGVEKGAILDWSDYFFLHFMPFSLRNHANWPSIPSSCRELVAEYGEEVVKLGGKLMKIFSSDLGLDDNHLQNAFGGDENIGACLRVNFYPKCPQPDLTLGLSPHSDPGGMTILLPDEHVSGLQVRRGDNWVTVKPVRNAFIINIGDQIQVLSNAIYKSVEHRVTVNSDKDRVSLAMFYNPRSDLMMAPCKQLVTKESPALYQPMTFDKYRTYIRTKGPCGKKQVESLKCL